MISQFGKVAAVIILTGSSIVWSSNAAADGASFAAKVPIVSSDAKGLIAKAYERREGNWALAISNSGVWSMPWSSGKKTTAADIRRRALERCQHAAQAPCHLYALNEEVHYRNGAAPTKVDLQYGGKFDARRTPFVRDEFRRNDMRGRRGTYNSMDANRALALSRTGRWSTASGYSSKQDAIKKALKNCEGDRGNRGCFIYAVNGLVVFSPDTSIR